MSHVAPTSGAAAAGRPIRTLLFSSLYPSSARPNHGIFVETRLRELLKTGRVQTKVIAPVPWFYSTDPRHGERAQMAATPRAEVRHGIDVRHPRYAVIPKVGMTLAPLTLALAAEPQVRRLIREGFDFDLIDAHYYYPDGVAAAWLARRFRKPLAITARGTDLNLIPQYALPRRMIDWAAQSADASIGVCAALMDVLRARGLPDGKLHVMRNGVDLQRFSPQPMAQARAALGLPAEGPVLLSVGLLIERKGHHLVIDALPALLARHPAAHLVILGEGEERPALQQRIERLGLQQRVRLPGAIANDRMAQWYSAADVLVLASSREGWANVLLEAMACGTPVAATRVWGTPEVVADPVAGELIARRDAASIAEAVGALLARRPPREAVRRYAEGFGWEHTSQAQVALFERLATAKAGDA